MIDFFQGGRKMTVLQKVFLIFLCLSFVSGCYEDEAEIILNSDGSGTVKEKLVIPERLIVATSEGSSNENTPPVSKEKVLEQVGSAIDISSITQTELPDGGRIIKFEGAFRSAEQFFLSKFCRDTLKLRISPAGEGKGAIYCDMKQSSDGGPNLTQLYGLAKGLYIKRTVHLPTKVEKTNGYFDKAKNAVSWATDLRNKEGLGKTKLFIEGADEGKGFAVFSSSGLKFSLPLKGAALREEQVEVEKEKEQKEPAAFAAKVCWISVKKKIAADDTGEVETSDLEIGIEVRWNEGHCPVRCEKPVLVNLLDDLNKDLVSDKGPRVHQGQIFYSEERNKRKELTLRAETPSKNAKKLKQLEGYVPVITDIEKERVVLENVQELAGKESTGNPVLDKLNFRIKSIKAYTLNIQIDGGHQTITSLAMFKEDGSKVKRSGGMGSGNEYSYDFREDITKVNKCELEVAVSESSITVPFSRQEIPLP
jgi:hypothetical protein